MRKIYDPMEFQPGMEQIDSDIFSRVIQARKQYQPEDYTAAQVKAALRKENLSFEDFAALLSPAAQPFLEQMAQRAKAEREKHFGNNQLLREPVRLLRIQLQECHHPLQAERRGNRIRDEKHRLHRHAGDSAAHRREPQRFRTGVHR